METIDRPSNCDPKCKKVCILLLVDARKNGDGEHSILS